MKYLKKFSLPTFQSESLYDFPTKYPFSLFSSKDFYEVYFSDVTIFYGSNGSGKSTLLNVINHKFNLKRRSSFFADETFKAYVDKCSFQLEYNDDLDELYELPKNSKIIASEDVFNHILNIREENIKNEKNSLKLKKEYSKIKKGNVKFGGLKDYESLVAQNEVRSKTQTSFIRERTNFIKQFSNGESSLRFFYSELENDGLYLLDEPENSLSPEFQVQLMRLIVECSRYCNCQFIIATHSPFLLSIPGAKIYNLDDNPVDVCDWTELENVRFYYDFFKSHEDEFE